jgi:predicted RecA/RadA family phage recombinase
MPAPTFVRAASVRTITAAADLVCGTIVASTDGLAGYVEAQRGIRNGETGLIRIEGVVEVDKASADNIAAGARMQINTSTQVASVLASGSPTGANILCGRAVAAAGVGTVRMLIDLNRNLNQA